MCHPWFVVSLGCVILGLLKVSDVSSLVCCKSWMCHPWFVVSLGCVILGLLKVLDVSSLVCCKSRMCHPWFVGHRESMSYCH